MTLATAPCPNCRGVVVYGDRRCRICGQSFDYGAAAPPEPTPEQSQAALAAACVIVAPPPPTPSSAPGVDNDSILAAFADAVVAVRPPLAQGVRTASGNLGAASLVEVDTGRYFVGGVVPDTVPGLVDSTLYAGMVPDQVDVERILDLEQTRVEAAPGTAGPMLSDLERHHADVTLDAAAVDVVPDVFRSPVFHIDVAAGAAAAGELLEVSPSAPRRPRPTPGGAGSSLERVSCLNCGTVHAAPRCPHCAAVHPAALAR